MHNLLFLAAFLVLFILINNRVGSIVKLKFFLHCSVFFLLVFSFQQSSFAAEINEAQSLLRAVDLALTKSDLAADLHDNLVLSMMDVASEEHKFATKLIPLTKVGFTQGTGTQLLGMELRKDLPTGAAVSYGFVGDRIDDNSGYVVENPTSARAFVRLSQGLFRRWGERYNLTDLNASELRQKKEEIRTERSRQALILDTVKKFYDLVLAKQLLDIAKKAYTRNVEHFNSASSKQAVGLVSKVDVYRAEMAVLDAENVVQKLERAKNMAFDTLRDFLQLPDDSLLEVPEQITRLSPTISESWEEDLYTSRLDWQALRVSLEIAKLEMYKARQNLTPDIGLSLTLEQKGEGDSVEEALDLDQTNWSVQLEMLSSLDTFEEESTLSRKQIEMSRLRRSQKTLKRTIAREVSDAFQDLLVEENSQHISMRKFHQAERALDLALTRYERGLSDNLDVLDAENSLSEAELGISRSLSAYNVAGVSLAYKIGVLDRQWLELSLRKNDIDSVVK